MPVYIFASPLGNLEDISLRALSTLKELDVLLCEDTRVSSKLLARYAVKVPMKSVHEHTDEDAIRHILSGYSPDKHIGYITDAGTPGLADPGGKVISACMALGMQVIPLPGPSSFSTLVSVCHFPIHPIEVHGFAPTKKGRKTFLEHIVERDESSFFCESPHRIMKTMEYLAEHAPHRYAVVGKELTKQFEKVYNGEIGDIYARMKVDVIKGEFSIILGPRTWK